MNDSTTTDIQPTNQTTDISPLAPDDGLRSDIQALESEWEGRIGKGTFAESDELATWYRGKEAELDQMAVTIKLQAEAMIRAVERRRDGLRWRWGAQFKSIVDHKLHMQGGKKKSVELLTGRTGYRSTPERLDILDDKALVEWCSFNCPAALGTVIARKNPIKEFIKTNGELPPGVRLVEKTDQFFPPILINNRLEHKHESEQQHERT